MYLLRKVREDVEKKMDMSVWKISRPHVSRHRCGVDVGHAAFEQDLNQEIASLSEFLAVTFTLGTFGICGAGFLEFLSGRITLKVTIII